MNCLNQVILEGEVVEVTETVKLPNGNGCCDMKVVTKRTYTGKGGEEAEETNVICKCHGLVCESVQKHAKKGRGVRIVGRLKEETWSDADGKSHSRMVVVCEHSEFKPIKSNQEVV